MSVIISSDLIIADLNGSVVPLKNSRIGHQTYTRTGSVVASSSQTGFPAAAAKNPLTYEFWRPVSLPATWRLDIGSAQEVDYVGIAAHSLGSTGCTVHVEYSTNDSTWTTVSSLLAGQDGPIMFLFMPITARYWRIRITGSTIPSVGVVYIGKALAMQRPIYSGHTPITLSRVTEMRPNKSEGGQWLGRSIIRRGSQTQAEYRHLEASWVRTHFDKFIKDATRYPYFFAWRPSTYPEDVGYVWTSDDITPSNMGVRDYMSVSWAMEGIAIE
jgi:hypothetical protein